MAQWFRVHIAPSEDQGSIPSTHMVVYNHLQLQFCEIQCFLLTSLSTSIHAGKILKYIKYFFLNLRGIKYPSDALQDSQKQETNPKPSRHQETVNIMEEMNEIDTKRTTHTHIHTNKKKPKTLVF